eukprot:COSAG01_NODE_7501_length_3181_cov_3.156716_2_plen_225_part_00
MFRWTEWGKESTWATKDSRFELIARYPVLAALYSARIFKAYHTALLGWMEQDPTLPGSFRTEIEGVYHLAILDADTYRETAVNYRAVAAPLVSLVDLRDSKWRVPTNQGPTNQGPAVSTVLPFNAAVEVLSDGIVASHKSMYATNYSTKMGVTESIVRLLTLAALRWCTCSRGTCSSYPRVSLGETSLAIGGEPTGDRRRARWRSADDYCPDGTSLAGDRRRAR